MFEKNKIYTGNVFELATILPEKSIDCIVTSPPYYKLRNYNIDGQLGSEKTPSEFIDNLVKVFRILKNSLKDDGQLWLNIGDTYSRGDELSKEKELIGIPWRLALALSNDGWLLRQDIIWAKGISGDERIGSTMPEPVRDRFVNSKEYIFLFTKNKNYYFNADSIREKLVSEGKARKFSKKEQSENRNDVGRVYDPAMSDGFGKMRSVWRINPQSGTSGKHIAGFPEKIPFYCISAGTRPNSDSVVLDPFMGSGTVAKVALELGRSFVGFELNPDYVSIAENRIKKYKNNFY